LEKEIDDVNKKWFLLQLQGIGKTYGCG